MPLPYRLLYKVGLTPWDSDAIPADLSNLIEGASALPSGRALDLGCGTGTHAIYLAHHGWEVIGVDIIPKALQRAERKANGIEKPPTWVCGDATRLDGLGLGRDFSLILDIGCLFAFDATARGRAVTTLGEITRPGGHLLRFGLTDGEDATATFGDAWEVLWYRNERDPLIKRKNASPAWSLLRRR